MNTTPHLNNINNSIRFSKSWHAFPIVIAALAFAGLFVVPSTLRADPPLPGAIFTTDSTCTEVNVNSYADKDDVYIDGGPAHPGAAGLPDGYYCVQVTDPSGATVLGMSDPGAVAVVDGEFVDCYQLTAILKTASSGFTVAGFDDTPNPGGEYKVWVSTDCNFDNNSTKTDNFQVNEGCERGTVSVTTFYDTNANGVKDGEEQDIVGWRFRVFSHDNLQLAKETPKEGHVRVGTYTMVEVSALERNWVHTNATQVECTLEEYDYMNIAWGNVSIGAGGGNTAGFWGSQTGQLLTTSDDLTFLSSLYLRNAKGLDFNPTTVKGLSNWLLKASTTNMAYMLSAQLAAMELSVRHSYVSGSALVYAPDLLTYGTVTGLNGGGFITVNDLMAAAAAEIQAHAVTKVGSLDRPFQEALKTALEDANNNKTFVQSVAGPFSFE
jgi:hypothetical protein